MVCADGVQRHTRATANQQQQIRSQIDPDYYLIDCEKNVSLSLSVAIGLSVLAQSTPSYIIS